MIDRYLVRYFLAVIDHGNFSRAAAACRVSQPTLSVGIAKLERSVGAPLFNRSNRRVEVTEAGARFTEHARRIEAAFGAAEGVSRQTEPRPLLRLGVLSTLPGRWLETALAAVRRDAPDDRIEVFEATQRDLLGLLGRGRIDAAIAVAAEGDRRARPYFSEPYVLTLPTDHTFAGDESVRAEALAGEAMIVRRHCEALSETSRHFTRRGVRPFMAARTTSDDRALAYVRSGLAITVMPRCFQGAGAAMPRLAEFDIERTIAMLVEPDNERRMARSPGFGIIDATYRAQSADL